LTRRKNNASRTNRALAWLPLASAEPNRTNYSTELNWTTSPYALALNLVHRDDQPSATAGYWPIIAA
jgi:hypothetical protein